MTKQEADFIGSMNMCDEISNKAYKKIMCNCEIEESQPCEDCISLNKLDDVITKAIDDSENQTECQTLRWVLDVMSELPSVTPQPKTGHWEELGIVMEGRMYEHGECDMQDAWGCDYCGYQVYMPTKYCPNCGAKMEVE